jgi:hypothetical protein
MSGAAPNCSVRDKVDLVDEPQPVQALIAGVEEAVRGVARAGAQRDARRLRALNV